MKTQSLFQQNYFVDIDSITKTTTYRLIIERKQSIEPDNPIIVVKDTYNSNRQIQSYFIKDSKVLPFRTKTLGKSVFFPTIAKRIQPQQIRKNIEKIKQFNYVNQTPASIIQFIRGVHFFCLEDLYSSIILNQEEAQLIKQYGSQHLKFTIAFFNKAKFIKQEKQINIYQDNEIAYQSCLFQIFQNVKSVLLINRNSQKFKKQNCKFMAIFHKGFSHFLESQLMPILFSIDIHNINEKGLVHIVEIYIQSLQKQYISASSPLKTFLEHIFKSILQKLQSKTCREEQFGKIKKYLDQIISQFVQNSEERKLQKVNFYLLFCLSSYNHHKFNLFINQFRSITQLIKRQEKRNSVYETFKNFILKNNLLYKIICIQGQNQLQNLKNYIIEAFFEIIPEYTCRTIISYGFFFLLKANSSRINIVQCKIIQTLEQYDNIYENRIKQTQASSAVKDQSQQKNLKQIIVQQKQTKARYYSVQQSRNLINFLYYQEKSNKYNNETKIRIFTYIIKLLQRNPIAESSIIEYLKQSFIDFKKSQVLKQYIQKSLNVLNTKNWTILNQILLFYYVRYFQVDEQLFERLCSSFHNQKEYTDEEIKIHQNRTKTLDQILKILNQKNNTKYLKFIEIIFNTAFKDNSCLKLNRQIVSHLNELGQYEDLQKLEQFISKLDYQKIESAQAFNIFYKLVIKINLLEGNIINILVPKTKQIFTLVVKQVKYLNYFFQILKKHFTNQIIKRTIFQKIQVLFLNIENKNIQEKMFQNLINIFSQYSFKGSEISKFLNRLRKQFNKNFTLYNLQTIKQKAPLEEKQYFIVGTLCLKYKERLHYSHLNSRYYAQFLQEKKAKNQNLIIQFKYERSQFIQILRYDFALKSNLNEPQSYILKYNGIKLTEEDMKKRFYEIFKDQKHYVQFQIDQNHLPLLISKLLDKIQIIYQNLPYTKGLLFNFSLLQYRYKFPWKFDAIMNKIENQITLKIWQFSEQTSIKNKLFFQFAFQNIDKDYNYTFLIEHLKNIQKVQDYTFNIKILLLILQKRQIQCYLIDNMYQSLISAFSFYHSNKLSSQQKDQIGPFHKVYINLIIECLQQIYDDDTFFYIITNLDLRRCISQIKMREYFFQFLQKSFQSKSQQRKKQIFYNFPLTLVKFPQNWQFCQQFLGNPHMQQLIIYEQYLQNLINLITSDTNTIQKQRAYSYFISYLVGKGLRSKLLYSQQFIRLLLMNFYNFGDETYQIFRAIMQDENFSKIICNFFHSQIRQDHWGKMYFLQKQNKKYSKNQLVGLKNPHSICYANSFLQQLFHITQFREELLKTQWQRNISQPHEDLVWQLKRTFAKLKYFNEPFCNFDFFNAFKDQDGQPISLQYQRDVDEFKTILLDRLQNKIPKENNFIKQIFTGKQATITKSLECQHSSIKQQQYTSICLDVKNLSNLNESLTNYSKPQLMQDENAYQCQYCKIKVRAEKHIQIIQFPKILIFVLKRFEYLINKKFKINTKLQFPLDKFQIKDGVYYKLKGIIIHQGFAEFGHYFSLIQKEGKWYQFNDSFVSEVNTSYVQQIAFGNDQTKSSSNKNAYLLIFQKIKQSQIQIIPQNISLQSQIRQYPNLGQQIMKIKSQINLGLKQQKFFDFKFMNFLVKAFKILNYCHIKNLILQTFLLINSKLIIKDVQSLTEMLIFIKQNKNNFPIIFTDYYIHELFKIIINQEIPIFQIKSIVIDILVSNFSIDNFTNENKYDIGCFEVAHSTINFFFQFMDYLLRLLYNDQYQNSCIFQLFEKLCRKTQTNKIFVKYFQERATVFRIIDITFFQILGQAVRADIKERNNVLPYQFTSPFKYDKDKQKIQYRYKKWSFLTYLIEHSTLSKDQQQLLFKSESLVFKEILSQCDTKVNLNYIAKYLTILSKKNISFGFNLMSFLSNQNVFKNYDCIRKCMKIIKQLLKIQDEYSKKRHQKAIQIFDRILKKQFQNKYQGLFDLTWSWVLKIAKKNINIQNYMSDNKILFQWLLQLSQHNFSCSKIKQLKMEKNKHKYHGLKIPHNIQEFNKYLAEKIQISKNILQGNQIIHDENDSDEDATNYEFKDPDYCLNFNDQQNKYQKHKIVFTYADIIFLKNSQKHDNSLDIFSKSNQKLMPFHQIESQEQQIRVEQMDNQSSISAESSRSDRTSLIGMQDSKKQGYDYI